MNKRVAIVSERELPLAAAGVDEGSLDVCKADTASVGSARRAEVVRVPTRAALGTGPAA
jgi:hypothetical protein